MWDRCQFLSSSGAAFFVCVWVYVFICWLRGCTVFLTKKPQLLLLAPWLLQYWCCGEEGLATTPILLQPMQRRILALCVISFWLSLKCCVCVCVYFSERNRNVDLTSPHGLFFMRFYIYWWSEIITMRCCCVRNDLSRQRSTFLVLSWAKKMTDYHVEKQTLLLKDSFQYWAHNLHVVFAGNCSVMRLASCKWDRQNWVQFLGALQALEHFEQVSHQLHAQVM